MPFNHLLPSAVKQFIEWAAADIDLQALHGGRVGTKLAGVLPALRIQRVGGSPAAPWEDHPLLQVEAWGQTEADADDLIRALIAALPRFRGPSAGGLVHASNVESGPFWAPDSPNLSDNLRYIITVRLLTTP